MTKSEVYKILFSLFFILLVSFQGLKSPFTVYALEEELYYIHKDHLGSNIVITDSKGKVAVTSRYYPYGSDRVSEGSENLTDKKYTSQRKDNSTQLYYYNARYYDPELGTFISADTVNDQVNRFAYVANNPINSIDPTGNRVDAGGGSSGGDVIGYLEYWRGKNKGVQVPIVDFNEIVGLNKGEQATGDHFVSMIQWVEENYPSRSNEEIIMMLRRTGGFKLSYSEDPGSLINRLESHTTWGSMEFDMSFGTGKEAPWLYINNLPKTLEVEGLSIDMWHASVGWDAYVQSRTLYGGYSRALHYTHRGDRAQSLWGIQPKYYGDDDWRGNELGINMGWYMEQTGYAQNLSETLEQHLTKSYWKERTPRPVGGTIPLPVTGASSLGVEVSYIFGYALDTYWMRLTNR